MIEKLMEEKNCMQIVCFVFSPFAFNTFFLSSLVVAYVCTRFQKVHISGQKNDHILLKYVLLKLNFQDKGHLYAHCLFYILSFCLKCVYTYADFHPGRSSKSTYYRPKNVHILLKILPLKLKLQDEVHMDANFLTYILTIYRGCFLFQLFSCSIRMHIPILTGVLKRHFSG